MEVNNGHATKKHRDIGITNPYYTDTAIKKDLKDDTALLQSAFKKFNEEFWDGEIDKSTIILIGAYCEAKRPDLRSETVAFRF